MCLCERVVSLLVINLSLAFVCCREQTIHIPHESGASWRKQFKLGHERCHSCF